MWATHSLILQIKGCYFRWLGVTKAFFLLVFQLVNEWKYISSCQNEMDFSKSNQFESEKGTIGNLLTIIAIRRNRQMHTTFNGKVISVFPYQIKMNLNNVTILTIFVVFIANLCLIDLLTASTMLPLNVTSYALGNLVHNFSQFSLDQLV